MSKKMMPKSTFVISNARVLGEMMMLTMMTMIFVVKEMMTMIV